MNKNQLRLYVNENQSLKTGLSHKLTLCTMLEAIHASIEFQSDQTNLSKFLYHGNCDRSLTSQYICVVNTDVLTTVTSGHDMK